MPELGFIKSGGVPFFLIFVKPYKGLFIQRLINYNEDWRHNTADWQKTADWHQIARRWPRENDDRPESALLVWCDGGKRQLPETLDLKKPSRSITFPFPHWLQRREVRALEMFVWPHHRHGTAWPARGWPWTHWVSLSPHEGLSCLPVVQSTVLLALLSALVYVWARPWQAQDDRLSPPDGPTDSL